MEKASKELALKFDRVLANIRREYGEMKNRQAKAYMYGGDKKFWKEIVEKMDEAIRETEEENEEERLKIAKKKEEIAEIVAEKKDLEQYLKDMDAIEKILEPYR